MAPDIRTTPVNFDSLLGFVLAELAFKEEAGDKAAGELRRAYEAEIQMTVRPDWAIWAMEIFDTKAQHLYDLKTGTAR